MSRPTPQAGDEIYTSCEPATARVHDVSRYFVFIEWPWRVWDDTSTQFRWSGRLSLPRDDSSEEWQNTAWRVEPNASQLAAGDTCKVFIPRTLVHVYKAEAYDAPLNLGWTPGPTLGLAVVRPELKDRPEAIFTLYLGGADPVEFEFAKS